MAFTKYLFPTEYFCITDLGGKCFYYSLINIYTLLNCDNNDLRKTYYTYMYYPITLIKLIN